MSSASNPALRPQQNPGSLDSRDASRPATSRDCRAECSDGGPIGMTQSETEEIEALLLSTAMSAFFVVDAARKVIQVNSSFCELTGYTEKEVIGRHCATLGTICGGGKCPFIDLGSRSPNRARECTFLTKSGRRLSVLKSATPLISGGQVRAVIESFVDVTEQVESRETARSERDRARRALEEASHAKERMEKLLSLASEREIQMVRLKAEVNRLLERQGQQPKYLAPREIERLFGTGLAADV